ncbi:cytochrome P450 [Streptomyces sp. AV19]|uniref:cytochrome P450 n=1 Tax=Streptomyces sp. AV19 TaxID=2793068 RepID=UPI0018FE9526|nr:cytochrome P450 [Streptomyces sp. AV19]MBH1934240.1 cytochrome P450 [Streptomyces sp. AV19]MDG4533451.1 cytochrome P450 [Streptomyces sp. AV19]
MTTVKQHDPIPTAPGALPLLGHALPLLRDPLGFLASLPARGELVQIGIGPQRVVMAFSPELIRQILLDDRTFDKSGPLFDQAREILGDGLVTCPHARHRGQRRMIQPAFHPTRLTAYAPVMTERISSVTDAWRNGQSIDVLSQMVALTSRVMLTTMFGTALGAAQTAQAMDDFTVLFSGLYKRVLQPAWLRRLPHPVNRRFHRANARLRATVATLVAEHRTHDTPPAGRRQDGTEHDSNLLSMLLAARDTGTDGRGLTAVELADETVTFFLGGIETTAAHLAWTLHLLAQHPDIEHRLHTEVDTVLAGRPPAPQDLPRLELTGWILTETLRLYPPAWLLNRTATADTHLAEHLIPAGTTIAFSPYLIQRHPGLYPDPERFDPDRWRTPSSRRDAYLPFGGGARKCIGDAFALTEATLALAHIAAHWQLRPTPGARARTQVRATLRPQGLRMQTVVRDDRPRRT